ncbi:MAG: hypothetical protein AB7H88_10985 [Vicinamibacterales bacterium]
MATPHPSPDGIVRESRGARLVRTTFNVVGTAAVVAAPLAAVTLWLLLTDPATAAAVHERGDLVSVMTVLAKTLGKAVAAVLAYL